MKDQRIRAYLDAQKTEHGRPWVIAFPTLYPREVLTALDVNVWEVWSNTSLDATTDPGKLQGYLCPTVRGAQAVLARRTHGASVAVMPHTCDSLQGLATIARTTPEWGVKVINFRHPRGTERPAARVFLRKELEAFIAELEAALDRKLDLSRLASSLELHAKVEQKLASVLRRRAHLPIADAALYAILRAVEWMHPSDFLAELESLEAQVREDEPKRAGVGVVISGMVPEPDGLFETLADAGAYVAADDYAAIGRRIPGYAGPMQDDPIGAVVERMMMMPPCPTRAADSSRRIARLIDLARSTGSRGVVLHTVKFCEPELFDIPLVRRALEEAGLKVLHLETELEPRVTGQISTRVEAFVEMLGDGRDA